MSDEFANLSELELLSFIGRAEEELKRRKRASKDKIKEEIEARLQAAGINLSDLFPEAGGAKRKRKTASDGGEAQIPRPGFSGDVVRQRGLSADMGEADNGGAWMVVGRLQKVG